MTPYIPPPPKPLGLWDIALLGLFAWIACGALSAFIWAFFAAMPVGERAMNFIVDHL